jgi:UDP-N-acetyl-D-galactosamine dehydrogenase
MKKICVVGLGYVGLPLAVAMAKKFYVLGFDINKKRIDELNSGYDNTNELLPDEVKKYLRKSIFYTYNEKELSGVNFYIITVPTPINSDKSPDLRPIISATTMVSKYLKKGDIVVFESTVYPGLTEEICVPLLEKETGLKINDDFHVGYSPERINPGDKKHTITKIKKVVSGSSKQALDEIAKVYEQIIEAGIHKAESIKVAEAAKVIENTQRDINIAFVNELAMIFGKMGIDTHEVLKAAGTKWNFLNFFPGLVGGHCIGVDPYYLASKAQEIGHNPEMILAGRRINDHIPNYIVNRIIKKLYKNGRKFDTAKALILGATFKEDCPDIRNSKVEDIHKELQDFGIQSHLYDPLADIEELRFRYGKQNVLSSLTKEGQYDIIILAVAHQKFKDIDIEQLSNTHTVVFDVKAFYPHEKGYLRL